MEKRGTAGGERRRARRGSFIAVAAVAALAGVFLFLLPWWQDRIAPPHVPPSALEDLPASPITMSVVYEASPLLESLETAVPDRIGDISERFVHPSDTLLRYAYQADRTPFEVEVRNSGVVLTTTIEYGGRVWYATPLGLDVSASCGVSEGRLRAVIRFSSPIAIAEDWTVRPRIRLDRIEPLTAQDRCRVGALGVEFDITDAIIAETERRLRAEAARMDQVLSAIDPRPYLDEYWQMIREPIALGEGVWLTLNPESFRYDEIDGSGPEGRTLRTVVNATTRPQIVLGPRPEVADAPLPPLERGSSGDFDRTVVDGLAGYEGLSELLTRELRGLEVDIAGLALELRQVAVTRADEGKLAAEVDVEGTVDGRVRLTGTPVFDPVLGQIAFPDLDFHLETGSTFARAYLWILRTAFMQQVRNGAHLALDDLPQLHHAFAGLSSPEESGGALRIELGGLAHLEGSLNEVELIGLAVTDQGLLVRSRVDANTTVRVGE